MLQLHDGTLNWIIVFVRHPNADRPEAVCPFRVVLGCVLGPVVCPVFSTFPRPARLAGAVVIAIPAIEEVADTLPVREEAEEHVDENEDDEDAEPVEDHAEDGPCRNLDGGEEGHLATTPFAISADGEEAPRKEEDDRQADGRLVDVEDCEQHEEEDDCDEPADEAGIELLHAEPDGEDDDAQRDEPCEDGRDDAAVRRHPVLRHEECGDEREDSGDDARRLVVEELLEDPVRDCEEEDEEAESDEAELDPRVAQCRYCEHLAQQLDDAVERADAGVVAAREHRRQRGEEREGPQEKPYRSCRRTLHFTTEECALLLLERRDL